MNLTVLGGHGTFPVAGGACSGYLLEQDGFRLWMDAGNGTLGKLLEHCGFQDVDAIWISHAHADHSVDLYPYFYRMLATKRAPVPVFAPSGVRDKLASLIGDDSIDAWRTLLDWREVDAGDEDEIGPFKVKGFASEHTSKNTILRLEHGGKTFVYSGDTGPCEDIVPAARGADVFLCEASWVDESQVFSPIHLLASEAGNYGREAGVDRLVLTHVWAENDRDRVVNDASSAFGGEVSLAYETPHVEI